MTRGSGPATATGAVPRQAPGEEAPAPVHAAAAEPRTDDAGLRRAMRRLLVVTCLLPLLLLLARRVVELPDEAGWGVFYGCAVLTVAAVTLYLAYTHYEDPALHPSRRRRAASFPSLGPTPRVSLLLAVKDEADRIEACVRSMAGSDWPDLQVIVVDDGSTDGTGTVLARLRDELGVTVLPLHENVGKKRALVRAAALAEGEVLAFTDSDCVLEPDAVRRCVEALVLHPDLGAVSGHCRALNADATILSRMQDVWYEGQFRVSKAAEAVFGSVNCVSGPLAVFRRDAVWNYLPAWAADRFLGAPFRFATDRQLTGYVLGQHWTGQRLKQRHAHSPFVSGQDFPARRWNVGYVRCARVATVVPARLRPFLRQQIRWKKSFVRNLFFTGTFMWRRGPGPAFLYYTHALCVAAAPVLVARHLVWAPMRTLLWLTALYLCGVALKGCVWAVAYRLDHPGDTRWRYRPLTSLLSCTVLSWLLPYALVTIRRGVWKRSPA